MKNIAIFASGSGTNAERISKYFMNHPSVRVKIIMTNNEKAFVIERAKKMNINTRIFSREELNRYSGVTAFLKENEIELIVLAGFLWLIPQCLIAAFPNKIVNIHPALLPKFGGKNMYGIKVHQAVIDAGEKESGITIHIVDEIYDHGKVLFQAKCSIDPGDSPEILASKIHELEYEHFPKVIEKLLSE
ncbi:MAG: phosphoribosylglycinamide formyltransferase [Bacteroidales bacterium]|nr:phosphoribosylglycinamide formyltransferase [Bacteroidales bacterium]